MVEVDDIGGKLRVWTEAGESIEADYLLFAIGRVPQTDFLSAELVNQNVKGLYFVGDVRNGLYRQAAIAAGDGLRAAMDIYFKMISEA
jgi:thioredoxin reductase